jgi:hypothetical protein
MRAVSAPIPVLAPVISIVRESAISHSYQGRLRCSSGSWRERRRGRRNGSRAAI